MQFRSFPIGAWMALGLLAACATVPTRSGDEPQAKVVDIRIEGSAQVDEADIKESILTSESSLLPDWVPVLGKTYYFDVNVWQADLRRIERYYQARGYYQARVLEEFVDDSRPGVVRLRVVVEEGQPTRLSEITLEGTEGLSPRERDELREVLPFKVKDVFLEDKWKGLKNKLENKLREFGYAMASVEGDVSVDVDTRQAAVKLTLNIRQRFRFGNIFVTGNKVVSQATILDLVRTELREGWTYQESLLANAQARVFQLGVFSAVRVNRAQPDTRLGTVPVVVDVREAPFRTERAGAGIGLDRNRQEIRAVGEYTHRNFYGALRRYTLRGQVGYAFLPNIWDVAQGQEGAQNGVTAKVLNEFEQPRFLHPRLDLKTSIELLRNIEPAYNYFGGNLRIALPFAPHKNFTVTPSYNLNVYLLSSQVPFDDRSPEVAFGCPLTCALSYLEQNLEWDRRDDPIEPHNGYYVGLALQEGGGPLQGAFTYLRIQPDLRAYQSFGGKRRFTLAAKVKMGTLLSENGNASPIVARFFSGGGVSMRGFNTRRLSPLLAVQRRGLSTDTLDDDRFDTVPIGGNGLFESSVELRTQLTQNIVFATFFDSGFVSAEAFPFSQPSKIGQLLMHAAGFGFRYRTPLGPIRIDLAHRLPFGPPLPIQYASSRVPAVQPNSSCFGIGNYGGDAGSPEGWCTLHVSIGEAF